MRDQFPPIIRTQRSSDVEHLNLLSIFHFVGAGLAILGILFLALHYTFMSSFFLNPKLWENQKQGPPPAEFFSIFKWFYLAGDVWFLGSGVLNVLSGVFIRARKYRTFSIVVAAINCLHIPLGTLRESVRELYEAAHS